MPAGVRSASDLNTLIISVAPVFPHVNDSPDTLKLREEMMLTSSAVLADNARVTAITKPIFGEDNNGERTVSIV